ncbi:GNAT family N-acetyltransferase [Rathayibacter sp. VKM Ac-2803]|uniref:GNAT family N-acetyltransferase n=1 Tax=Rathayibacter sp. VKM Ac-2803 TaxID=2609256 RepID=UPI001359CD1F|nr:GNAT family N-acetyltransferase [Rathayibacter sp. VKM Ac-2803]MWV51326.1 GNAT family N-acetyltransferase [Rathayibacter sp. VKM Ac-2803]
MTWQITPVPFDHPDAEWLRGEQRRELDARYGSDDHEPGTVPSAGDVPVFLVATTPEGRPVGCGGLRPLPDAVVGPGGIEIKRMYVVPGMRGTGLAVAVLRALESSARQLGAERLVLETGTRQPDAIRFYEREGYESIPLFGSYVDSAESLCFARSLLAG